MLNNFSNKLSTIYNYSFSKEGIRWWGATLVYGTILLYGVGAACCAVLGCLGIERQVQEPVGTRMKYLLLSGIIGGFYTRAISAFEYEGPRVQATVQDWLLLVPKAMLTALIYISVGVTIDAVVDRFEGYFFYYILDMLSVGLYIRAGQYGYDYIITKSQSIANYFYGNNQEQKVKTM